MAIIINNNNDKARVNNADGSDPKHSRLDWKATASPPQNVAYILLRVTLTYKTIKLW